MHSQTDTEQRNIVFNSIIYSIKLSFKSTFSKSSGNKNTMEIAHNLFIQIINIRTDVDDVGFYPNISCCMLQGFPDTDICIFKLYIFTDNSNIYNRTFNLKRFYNFTPVIKF